MAKTKAADPLAGMAVDMYNNRVGLDKLQGIEAVHDHPDAQALYFKGVHDTILALETWVAGADKNTLARLLQALHTQTDCIANA